MSKLSRPDIGVSAEALDLLTFFECEPKPRDEADLSWEYNEWVYEFKSEGTSVSFAISPSYRDVKLVVKSKDAISYELNAKAVDDVKYHDDGGHELLEFVVHECHRVLLRLKPHVHLDHLVSRLL